MAAITNSKTAGTWTNSLDWTGGVPSAGDGVTISVIGGAATTMLLTSATNLISSLAINTGSSKNVTLNMSAAATLNVSTSISLTTAGGFAAKISGNGAINVTGIAGLLGGNGTLVASGGTLVVNATVMTSSMVLLGISLATNVLSLNLTNASTAAGIGVSGGSIVRLTAGSLTIAAINTGSQTGTIDVSGASAMLAVTGAVAMSSANETLLVSGGTLNLTAGGSLGAAGIVLADNAAGGAVRIGATLTAGTIAFAASGITSQTLFDDSAGGNALAGRSITGFHGTDQIVINGATQYKIISGGGTTTGTIGALNGSGTTLQVLSFAGGLTLGSDNAIISGATLTASAACYLAGTHVATLTGAVAVEDLVIGDLLITADAGPQAIRWIGQRAYLARLVNQHHRAALMPVRINAGALGDNIPSSDLFVSPEHMMVLNGVLVAAHSLLNGTTITRFENLDVVKYFHIELDQHSVIFAEGAASESYLDTGNRNMFTNVVDYAELGMPVGSTEPCLPIVSDSPVLAAIRAGIADRAEACGFTTSADADLHLLVDGAVVYPSAVAGSSYSFDIAEHAGEIRIVSRSVVPAEIEAVSADRRRLGVAVAGLTLRGNGMSVAMLAGEKLLADGFFPADGGHRWTNGSAQCPAALLALMDGAFSVTVDLVGTGLRYPVASHGDVVALAAARGPRAASAQRLVA